MQNAFKKGLHVDTRNLDNKYAKATRKHILTSTRTSLPHFNQEQNYSK